MIASRAAMALAFCLPALAGQAETPPKQLIPATLTVESSAKAKISCGAFLAHWFKIAGDPFGENESQLLELYFNPETEAVYFFNSVGHPMAVEILYCGYADAIWPDVTLLDHRALARKSAETGAGLHLHCAPGAEGKLTCTQQPTG